MKRETANGNDIHYNLQVHSKAYDANIQGFRLS